jgi:cytoplasmic iron level regulating protein YaaA (DUF328/UPF0246 family)
MKYVMLISPAKNLKKQAAIEPERLLTPRFMAESKLIHRSLAKLKFQHIVDLMGVSATLARESLDMIKMWDHRFLYRAVEMFDGEVYRGLSVDTLSEGAQERMKDQLRILSGLYGVLHPDDLIAPYRLEMKTKLPVKKAENLYQFWGNKLAKQLSQEADYLVNLASDEYSKAVLSHWDKTKVITPVFMEENEGKPKVVMMYAKNARGKMARFVLENNIEQLTDIQGFDLDNYRFVQDLSQENRWVFLR